MIELCRLHISAIQRSDSEILGVPVQIVEEVDLRKVVWGGGREGHGWKVAKTIGDVKVEAVIGVFSPKGDGTIFSFDDNV